MINNKNQNNKQRLVHAWILIKQKNDEDLFIESTTGMIYTKDTYPYHTDIEAIFNDTNYWANISLSNSLLSIDLNDKTKWQILFDKKSMYLKDNITNWCTSVNISRYLYRTKYPNFYTLLCYKDYNIELYTDYTSSTYGAIKKISNKVNNQSYRIKTIYKYRQDYLKSIEQYDQKYIYTYHQGGICSIYQYIKKKMIKSS